MDSANRSTACNSIIAPFWGGREGRGLTKEGGWGEGELPKILELYEKLVFCF